MTKLIFTLILLPNILFANEYYLKMYCIEMVLGIDETIEMMVEHENDCPTPEEAMKFHYLKGKQSAYFDCLQVIDMLKNDESNHCH